MAGDDVDRGGGTEEDGDSTLGEPAEAKRTSGKSVVRSYRVSALTDRKLDEIADDLGVRPAEVDTIVMTFMAELMRRERQHHEELAYFLARRVGAQK
jgi:hypothetical protein